MSSDRGALLFEFENGTKIYKKGVFNGSAFIQVNVGVYTFGQDINLANGQVSDVAAGYAHNVGNGTMTFGVNPDGSVASGGLGGSIKGPGGTSADLAFAINGDGTFTTIVGASVGVDQLGLSAGIKVTDALGGPGQGGSIYNSVQVAPDGSYQVNTLVNTNKVKFGTAFEIKKYGPDGTLLDTDYEGFATQKIAGFMAAGLKPLCFVAGTQIAMWPLTSGCAADGESDLSKTIWQKPIEEIAEGDCVVSFDSAGNLTPSRVVRLFRNDAKILLDFFGTGVTPGHVYLRSEQGRPDRFETLIDILRDDAAIVTVDGQRIRASTGVPVGDPKDAFIQAVTGSVLDDGAISVRQMGKLRLGTRFITPDGRDHCLSDLIDAVGATVTCDGLVQIGSDDPRPFHWDFAEELPRPEDYILSRSGTNLTEMYRASEWHEQQPRLPAPLMRDGGPVAPASTFDKGQIAPNRPLAGSDERFASSNPPTLQGGRLVREKSKPQIDQDQEFLS